MIQLIVDSQMRPAHDFRVMYSECSPFGIPSHPGDLYYKRPGFHFDTAYSL
jgi:hypothetical protein